MLERKKNTADLRNIVAFLIDCCDGDGDGDGMTGSNEPTDALRFSFRSFRGFVADSRKKRSVNFLSGNMLVG